MNVINRIQVRLENFKADMDNVFAHQGVRCAVCGHGRALRPGDAGYFMTHGWPLCCGKTMKLVAMPDDGSSVPDSEAHDEPR